MDRSLPIARAADAAVMRRSFARLTDSTPAARIGVNKGSRRTSLADLSKRKPRNADISFGTLIRDLLRAATRRSQVHRPILYPYSHMLDPAIQQCVQS